MANRTKSVSTRTRMADIFIFILPAGRGHSYAERTSPNNPFSVPKIGDFFTENSTFHGASPIPTTKATEEAAARPTHCDTRP